MPSSEDIAWAAGFFEGEGCFSLSRSERPIIHSENADGKYVYPYASLVNTDLDVLERFAAIVEVGIVFIDTSPKKEHHKQRWVWRVQKRDDFKYFAELVRPFLGKRRTKRLEEVQASASPLRRHVRSHRIFCNRGHPLQGDNVKITKSTGKRGCRTCINANARKYYERQQQKKRETKTP